MTSAEKFDTNIYGFAWFEAACFNQGLHRDNGKENGNYYRV